MEFEIAQLRKSALKNVTPEESKLILQMFRDMIKTDKRFQRFKSETHINNVEIKQLSDLLHGDSYMLIVAEKYTKELVGGCVVRITDFGILKQAAVSLVYTVPKYRNKGSATTMMNKVDDIARAEGCGEIYIMVAPENKEARHVYERAGFIPRMVQMLKEVK